MSNLENFIDENKKLLPHLVNVMSCFDNIYKIHDIALREEIKTLSQIETNIVVRNIRLLGDTLSNKVWSKSDYHTFQSYLGMLKSIYKKYPNEFAFNCALSAVNVVVKDNLS